MTKEELRKERCDAVFDNFLKLEDADVDKSDIAYTLFERLWNEAVEPLIEALENANEYALQSLPHLGDIELTEKNAHQIRHAEYYIKQAHSWIEEARKQIEEVLGE